MYTVVLILFNNPYIWEIQSWENIVYNLTDLMSSNDNERSYDRFQISIVDFRAL